MSEVVGVTFMRFINTDEKKPISYHLHSNVHKSRIYDISKENGFSFIGISWVLEAGYFLKMKGSDKCVLCLDSQSQVETAKFHSIPYIVCPSATFCNLRHFKYGMANKCFDAVLNCRNSKWKRRHLAAEVESLVVIFYPSPRSSPADNINFPGRFKPNIVNGVYHKLIPEDVNAALSVCKVGLILSEKEGSPRAVVEYLLCGLPVVSTKANCGRWEFLNETNCLVVEDNPKAVNEGVKMAISYIDTGRFNPEKIAEDARNRINAFRAEAEKLVGTNLLWD